MSEFKYLRSWVHWRNQHSRRNWKRDACGKGGRNRRGNRHFGQFSADLARWRHGQPTLLRGRAWRPHCCKQLFLSHRQSRVFPAVAQRMEHTKHNAVRHQECKHPGKKAMMRIVSTADGHGVI